MAVSHKDCAPYLSATLFHTKATKAGLTGELRKAIVELLDAGAKKAKQAATSSVTRRVKTPLPKKLTARGLEISWFYYEERRPPPWYAGPELRDSDHHIVIVCHKRRLVAVTFSDAAARNMVVRAIGKAKTGPLRDLTRLSAREIESAFVEAQVRTLWLGGAHRRTVIKPDAKVLSGLELESALDPLEDQSYYFSSVRSTSTNQTLASQGRAAVVGASPSHARIWIGPTHSWNDFAERTEFIIDQAAGKIAQGPAATPAIPVLAQASTDIAQVDQPYDMAIIVPEQALAGIEADDAGERWLQQFTDSARFNLYPNAGSPNFEADVYWGDELLGRLAYDFETRIGGDVRLKVQKREWNDGAEHQQDLFRICRTPDYLTIYFDTGHTFARGHFYKTQFRDARFDDWEWVNMARDGINVGMEKPLDGRRFAVENIGILDDNSLFGLVARHWPNLRERGDATGWLICDDGAMESADFIHYADTTDPPHLTLIHVKGSHSDNANRGISVSDYEVVVGQAVKNLRHIDRGRLLDKLRANQEGQLADAVWYNGVRQRIREDVLDVLANAGSNMKKTVVVLQPRVCRGAYDRIRARMDNGNPSTAEMRRMQQLDALLLGARADCFGLGAYFKVIAEDDRH